MTNLNYINEEDLLLERPDIREKCNIRTDNGMQEYLNLYNAYNNLLIQFLMDEYSLIYIDNEISKRESEFKEVAYENKDLYQKSSVGYLKYLYLRNNLYIERLSNEERAILHRIYLTGDFRLTSERKEFIKNTFLKVILESPSSNNLYVNYGPDNSRFLKPANAIIIGVRYDEYEHLKDNDDALDNYGKSLFNLQILTNFLEYKIKKEKNIPFAVIKYDENSVKCKKKMKNRGI